MRTFVAMAHYDPQGQIAPHVRRHLVALTEVAEQIVFVTTAKLTDADAQWVSRHARLVQRENYGYDFFSYRSGLLEAEDLSQYDRVVVCNDTFVGPLVGYGEIFAEMDSRPVDFWGLTSSDRVRPHVQSFFVCFRSWVVRSQAFQHFWQRMVPLSDRSQVIHRYEVGMTTALETAGFRGGSYYNETPADAKIARLRMIWRGLLLTRSMTRLRRVERLLRYSREPWNPNAALADRALSSGALPIVKIDTLRYDPYGLGSDRLLRAGIAARADLFGDVPDYLARTAEFYPHRPSEKMPDPGPFRAAFPLVRYVKGASS